MAETAYHLERSNGSQLVDTELADYLKLLKPRVMSLVVFSGLAGLLLAPGTLHPILAIVAVLCIAVGSGAAGAINMWYDRDIDAVMERTKLRPIPNGRIAPGDALGFGIVLAVGSVAIMGLTVSIPAALILTVAILFYVFVYTIWLKRRTPQNIVIGGAAGAFPPMIGWASVTGSISIESIVLFALIFFWTPPHFWSLALYRAGDYEKAGVPMLPVVAGTRETKRQIIIYTLLLLPLAVAPALLGVTGWLYGVFSLILSLLFLVAAVLVWVDETERASRRMFTFSIIYLFLLFTLMIVDGSTVFSV
ncbi:MAG: protoheme IX farnesyltransferase [Rhodospirillaceae bacterium]|nr:protoheme IX farnesyltransferase [Rhodospirillaceae bacterium]